MAIALSPTSEHKYLVAVIGTGPGACFFIERLLAETNADIQVLVFEQSPDIGGLVRYGVAPDHIATKNALNRFHRVLALPQVSLRCNTHVNPQALQALAIQCDAVVWGGGPSRGKEVAFADQARAGGIAVTTGYDFAKWTNGWTNGDETSSAEQLAAAVTSARNVCIVGNGNVALDVARNLLRPPPADSVTPMVHAALAAQPARTIRILGRRGLEHNKFTPLEFREICAIEGAEFHPPPSSMGESALQTLADNRIATRVVEIAQKTASQPLADPARLHFFFHCEISGVAEGCVTAGAHTFPTDLLVSCIGYDFAPPADMLPVTLKVGWAESGARGTIPTNKPTSYAQADAVLAQLQAQAAKPQRAQRFAIAQESVASYYG